MLLLTRYVTTGRGNRQRGAYAGLQNRATNDLLCVRRLLEAGFEESAKPTTRSYLESIDLALACLGDATFAAAYAADNVDADAFWREQVGYGRIYKRIRHAMELANIDQASIEEKIDRRRQQKAFLSRSTHVDFSSSFRSWAPSPLGYPGMVSLDPHGVISAHTANHMACVVVETYEYCATVMKIMTSDAASDVLNRPRARKRLALYSAHFFTLQAMLQDHQFEDGLSIVASDGTDLDRDEDDI
jgi:hypothetical protein